MVILSPERAWSLGDFRNTSSLLGSQDLSDTFQEVYFRE